MDEFREFAEIVARMKTSEEFGKETPPDRDLISTLDELIVSARRLLRNAERQPRQHRRLLRGH